ncbi:LysR family transcriptional regulator [Mycolicibacterium sp. GCM10028919]|uniref:LysR family transcriptional regulator n=1 Tax=Mycolicibacterium sp. GCM10028919 TaxID=3273401 RepID=UPI003611F667
MTVDLNLMVSLDALLQERSVTRAAQRLGLSQPTLSAALGKLRRHFDDELLTRVGNAYQLTPLGERLVEQTADALSWTDRVFQTRPSFDPERSEHEFTIVVTDCHLPVFGRVLADLLTEHAPGVRLKFQHSTTQLVHGSTEQLRNVDAIALPQGALASMPSLQLYRDRWVCIVAADTADRTALTRDDMATRPWVMAYQHPFASMSPMPRLLAEGVSVRTTISTEDFLAVPYLVAGTDRIGLVPEQVARLHPRSAVTVADIPFELGHLVESLWWHPVHERDSAHIWLRQMASRAGQLITSAA